jgi:Rho GTPase-activating protein 1
MSRPQLSLKQRLAALASAPTGPTSPRPAHARKRSFFTTPWARRASAAPVEEEERDRVQDVMGRMIYQAGAPLCRCA